MLRRIRSISTAIAVASTGVAWTCGPAPAESEDPCLADPASCVACVPDCQADWQCGSDGCDGLCGTCGEGELCTGDRQCSEACQSSCVGRECGEDDCGNSCGTCDVPGEVCDYGRCIKDRSWVDSETGLMWWNTRSAGVYTRLSSASSACSAQMLGYTDWRLPTIDELRTLVKGCDATAPGGACGVTDTCTDEECYDVSACSCPQHVGKEQWDSGCYGHPMMVGQCSRIWTGDRTGEITSPVFWAIDFWDARPVALDSEGASGMCVRGEYSSGCSEACSGRDCGEVGGCVCGVCSALEECNGGTCGPRQCTPSCTRPDGKAKICGSDGCGGICGSGWAEANGYDCVDDGCCHVFLPGCFNGCDPELCCPGAQ